jgi:DNA invertase Pin-like site-specific DNA recombinase
MSRKPRKSSKPQPSETSRVVIYARVSTSKQGDDGVSLSAQVEKCRQYAALYGLEVVEVVEDVGSAATTEREGLQRALSLLGDTVDAVLVAKLDRLTRSVRDLGDLIEAHFQEFGLLSVGEQIDTRSAAGRLVLRVLASVGEWEREAIGERTSAAMQHMRSQGQYTGGHIPYGFALSGDGKLVPCAQERATQARARELASAGMSLRAIARELASEGRVSRTARPFVAAQVQRLLEE